MEKNPTEISQHLVIKHRRTPCYWCCLMSKPLVRAIYVRFKLCFSYLLLTRVLEIGQIMAGKQISIPIRNLVVKDCKDNLSQRKIAAKYGISRGAVQEIWAKYQKLGSVADRTRRGGVRKTDRRTDSMIIREIKKNPSVTIRSIKENLQLSVSDRTISRRIREHGLQSKFARKLPYISPKNKKARLEFAKKYLNKPISFWKRVLWTDESKFEIFNQKRRVRVWRKSGEALQDRHLQPTVKHGGGNIMVWGCFAWAGVGNLVRINGIMTADAYIDIINENLRESVAISGVGKDFIFQQDNDPKHTAKKTKAFFKTKRMNVLEWPAQSPDLNPIENLWAILDNKVDKTGVTNKDTYFTALLRAWKEINAQHLKNLVESMPKRLQKVIEARGGHIPY